MGVICGGISGIRHIHKIGFFSTISVKAQCMDEWQVGDMFDVTHSIFIAHKRQACTPHSHSLIYKYTRGNQPH